VTAGRGETPCGDETVWRWEVRDRRDEKRVFGSTTFRGSLEEQWAAAERLAAERMALLMWQVERQSVRRRRAPEWERLAGWRVRVWSPHGDVSELADDWLAVVRAGPLASRWARARQFAPPIRVAAR